MEEKCFLHDRNIGECGGDRGTSAYVSLSGCNDDVSRQNRIRIDRTKLDHFIDFANRPYFYQDVAFGTRKLKFDSGSKLAMPNVIRVGRLLNK